MLLVAALDTPTRDDIDDVIREAEQILVDAVLDDATRVTITRAAPPLTPARAKPAATPGCSTTSWRRISRPTTSTPWARSPPRRPTHD